MKATVLPQMNTETNLPQHLAVTSLSLDDAASIQQLYDRCSDYWQLCEGRLPLPSAAIDEFADRPQDCTPAQKQLAGVRADDGALVALIDYLVDYPVRGTWYLGLMLVTPALRSGGTGAALLTYFEDLARGAGAGQILVCVLDENRRAFRFWERHGFTVLRAYPPRLFGLKMHGRKEMGKILAEQAPRQ